jgi:hypothetical protein
MRMRLCLSVVSLASIACTLAAQTIPSGYKVPRTPDGHPDLGGMYDLATLTPLERPRGQNATLTKEEVKKLEGASGERRSRGDTPLAPDRSAPPVGGVGRGGGAGGAVGAYNSFWLDPGTTYNIVDGQYRSSVVIDPPDGRVPALTPGGEKRFVREYSEGGDPNSADKDLDSTPGAYDDPERRPLAERCLLGFGSTSGPPALNNGGYNNLHQIVQTPDSLMILTEMVHDARTVRMNAQHLPKTFRLWLGDSVGHWEGDTLVIDTTNFTDKTHFRGSTENLHVVERLTRTGPRSLLYRFTVEDSATWTRPWTGEMTWPLTDQHMYEYACHEANYALRDILKGVRLQEKERAEKEKAEAAGKAAR